MNSKEIHSKNFKLSIFHCFFVQNTCLHNSTFFQTLNTLFENYGARLRPLCRNHASYIVKIFSYFTTDGKNFKISIILRYIFIDGLDECSTPQAAKNILHWLSRQKTNFPHCSMSHILLLIEILRQLFWRRGHLTSTL